MSCRHCRCARARPAHHHVQRDLVGQPQVRQPAATSPATCSTRLRCGSAYTSRRGVPPRSGPCSRRHNQASTIPSCQSRSAPGPPGSRFGPAEPDTGIATPRPPEIPQPVHMRLLATSCGTTITPAATRRADSGAPRVRAPGPGTGQRDLGRGRGPGHRPVERGAGGPAAYQDSVVPASRHCDDRLGMVQVQRICMGAWADRGGVPGGRDGG